VEHIDFLLTYLLTYELQGHLGELSVSLCYDSSLSCLSIGVNSARNLKSKDLIGSSGEANLVKCY